MEVFDLRKEEWIKIENCECERTVFSTVLLKEKLILIGGAKNSVVVNTVSII